MFVLYYVKTGHICHGCELPIRHACYYHEWCEASYCTNVGYEFCVDCYRVFKARKKKGKSRCYDGYTATINKGKSTLKNSFWEK